MVSMSPSTPTTSATRRQAAVVEKRNPGVAKDKTNKGKPDAALKAAAKKHRGGR